MTLPNLKIKSDLPLTTGVLSHALYIIVFYNMFYRLF